MVHSPASKPMTLSNLFKPSKPQFPHVQDEMLLFSGSTVRRKCSDAGHAEHSLWSMQQYQHRRQLPPSAPRLPRTQTPRKCQVPAVITSVLLLSWGCNLGGCSLPLRQPIFPSPSSQLLMSLVFSSNHSSYNTGQGRAKNSSQSHMPAANAEAPSKGTSVTPCFLGNESRCDARCQLPPTQWGGLQRHIVSCDIPACDRRRVWAWGRQCPRTGRSMAPCPWL